MKRQSDPRIDKTLRKLELFMKLGGATLLQAQARVRLPLYCDEEIRKMVKAPSDDQLFLHLRRAVSLTLDEVGEQVLAEQAQASITLEQLLLVSDDIFERSQFLLMVHAMHSACAERDRGD